MPVTLHAPTLADEPEFIAATRRSVQLHHPWISPPNTRERYAAYLERYALEDQRSYLVREDDSNLLVGFVHANNLVRGALRSAYLGYAAFSGGEGRGLMTEAMKAAITELFTTEELHRVEANIQPQNSRSIELVKRLGFRHEGFSPDYLFVNGLWRDHERWALTVEMWINS